MVVDRIGVVVDRHQSGTAFTIARAVRCANSNAYLNTNSRFNADASDRRNVGCEQISDGDTACTR